MGMVFCFAEVLFLIFWIIGVDWLAFRINSRTAHLTKAGYGFTASVYCGVGISMIPFLQLVEKLFLNFSILRYFIWIG